MPRKWTPDQIMCLLRGFQPACVLSAAVDLDVFTLLSAKPLTADEAAARLGADPRGTRALLDAVAALGLLGKRGGKYRLCAGVGEVLTPCGKQTHLAMAWHQGNCLRNWVQLAGVVKSGQPAVRAPSLRGAEADHAAFIGAMDNISQPVARGVIRAIKPLRFTRLLDVGGASGSWTIAFLEAHREGRATLFDLPAVMPLAEARLTAAGVRARVDLVPGDFYSDPLPGGADLAWISAIVHQNSREQNRELFAKVHAVLAPGGRIAIRDIVMDESRTQPPSGALFAINMLVATAGGGTFTLRELREDLQAAGFGGVKLARRDPQWMHSIVVARKR